MDARTAMLARLRAREAEVWVRLRPPTLGEMVGRELEATPDEPSDRDVPADLLTLCEFIVDLHSDATWDDSTADLRRGARQLVEMVAPVMDDAAEVARRIDAWAKEWTDE